MRSTFEPMAVTCTVCWHVVLVPLPCRCYELWQLLAETSACVPNVSFCLWCSCGESIQFSCTQLNRVVYRNPHPVLLYFSRHVYCILCFSLHTSVWVNSLAHLCAKCRIFLLPFFIKWWVTVFNQNEQCEVRFCILFVIVLLQKSCWHIIECIVKLIFYILQ